MDVVYLQCVFERVQGLGVFAKPGANQCFSVGRNVALACQRFQQRTTSSASLVRPILARM